MSAEKDPLGMESYKYRFATMEEAKAFGDERGESYAIIKLDCVTDDDMPFMYVANKWISKFTVIPGDKNVKD